MFRGSVQAGHRHRHRAQVRLEQSKSSYYATSAAQDTCHLIVGSTIPKLIITVVKRSFFQSIEGLKQDFSCKPEKLLW